MALFHSLKIRTSIDIFSTEKCASTVKLLLALSIFYSQLHALCQELLWKNFDLTRSFLAFTSLGSNVFEF